MTNYFVVDVETTGLDALTNDIITLYGINCDENLKITSEVDLSFRPEGYWNVDAQAVHGITQYQASQFPYFMESFNTLIDSVPKGSTIVCHARRQGGSYFDKRFLETLFLKVDKRFEFFQHFPYSLSTHTMYMDLEKRGKVDKIKSRSLVGICDSLGVKLRTHHNAKDDTYMAYEALQELSRRQSVKGTDAGSGGSWGDYVRELRRDHAGVRLSIESVVKAAEGPKSKQNY